MNPYSIEEKNGRAACILGAASAVFCFLHILLSQGGRTDVCQGTAQIIERNSLIKDSLKTSFSGIIWSAAGKCGKLTQGKLLRRLM